MIPTPSWIVIPALALAENTRSNLVFKWVWYRSERVLSGNPIIFRSGCPLSTRGHDDHLDALWVSLNNAADRSLFLGPHCLNICVASGFLRSGLLARTYKRIPGVCFLAAGIRIEYLNENIPFAVLEHIRYRHPVGDSSRSRARRREQVGRTSGWEWVSRSLGKRCPSGYPIPSEKRISRRTVPFPPMRPVRASRHGKYALPIRNPRRACASRMRWLYVRHSVGPGCRCIPFYCRRDSKTPTPGAAQTVISPPPDPSRPRP
jgi:hypothetical protein